MQEWRSVFPNLEAEIARRGIKKGTICDALGISYRGFRNKMVGTAPITWDEVCIIQSQFFPDISKDRLFASCRECSDKRTAE